MESEGVIYLGNVYGLHSGYDGNVFAPEGIAKTITAGHDKGGAMHNRDQINRVGNLGGQNAITDSISSDWGMPNDMLSARQRKHYAVHHRD